jgi:hypothetical protein
MQHENRKRGVVFSFPSTDRREYYNADAAACCPVVAAADQEIPTSRTVSTLECFTNRTSGRPPARKTV